MRLTRRWLGLIGALLLLLGGCASAPSSEEQEAHREAVEDILSEPLGAEAYAETERCLSTHQYRSVEVLDAQHVLFRGPGDRAWLNTLRRRCIGLRRGDTLQFRLRDNRVCSLDTFEAVDGFFWFWDRTSGVCSLGDFAPVTPEQVEAIRAALADADDD
ncbi:MAG: DUF6491 family protein [Pseudomonadota bacterium]